MMPTAARYQARAGNRLPGGATWSEAGTNFAVYCQNTSGNDR